MAVESQPLKLHMMENKKRKEKTMIEVTKHYEDFITRQEIKENRFNQFEKAIKKAVTSKQRGSK